ncbi:unnamed protein product [Prorocentrum cordatum]|uniref:Retrotransposon gag domain-containing protein n=1 Tax=Prorocentrum cordatum TaxID=2364126 RepID=A0ABN9TTM9_9DINO|nr:unnamed protein product [Polarella glacialis]
MTYSMRAQEASVAAAAADAEGAASQCRILMRGPQGEAVKEHALQGGESEGALAHMTQEDGSYSICVRCDIPEKEKWSHFISPTRKMKWSIAFEVLGAEFSRVDPAIAAKMARMSHLKGPQAALESALERLAALESESAYEKEFEATVGVVRDAKFIPSTAVVLDEGLQVHMADIKALELLNVHTLSKACNKQQCKSLNMSSPPARSLRGLDFATTPPQAPQ